MIKNIKMWTKKYNSYLRFGVEDYSPILKDGLIAFCTFVISLFVLPSVLVAFYVAFSGQTQISKVTESLIQVFSELPLCLIALLFIRQFWEKISLLKFREEWINFLIFSIAGMAALFIVEDLFVLLGDSLYSVTHSGHTLPKNSTNENSLTDLKNASFILYLVLVIFVGPISEEIGTRLGIMNLVDRKWMTEENKNIIKWFLFALSSVLFGLMHVVLNNDYWHAFPYIGSGIVFASVYVFSGYKIHYSMSVHMSTNLVAVILSTTSYNSIFVIS